MRRVFLIILALLVLLVSAPALAWERWPEREENDWYGVTFDTETKSWTFVEYFGKSSNIVIPDQINGYPVTAVGFSEGVWNFASVPSVKSITLPAGLKLRSSSEDILYYGPLPIEQICCNRGCDNLKEYKVSAKNPYLTAKNGVVYSKDMKTLYLIPQGYSGTLTIPDGVETVYWDCVCNRIKIVFPASVKKIVNIILNVGNRSHTKQDFIRNATWEFHGDAPQLLGENGVSATLDMSGIKVRYDASKSGWDDPIWNGAKPTVQSSLSTAIKSVSLDRTKATIDMTKKETLQLTAAVLPVTAAQVNKVVWSSSNIKVATVDPATGLVTPVGTGKATITAMAGKKKAACKVQVIQSVESITSDDTLNVELATGKSLQLKTTVSPATAGNKKLTWSTSNKKIATVDKNGKVKAVGAGSCIITATAADGKGAKLDFNITVTAPVIVKAGMAAKQTVNVGDKLILTLSITPQPKENQKTVWASDNEAIATVSNSGEVTAAAPGKCKITATAYEGTAIVFNITVKEQKTSGSDGNAAKNGLNIAPLINNAAELNNIAYDDYDNYEKSKNKLTKISASKSSQCVTYAFYRMREMGFNCTGLNVKYAENTVADIRKALRLSADTHEAVDKSGKYKLELYSIKDSGVTADMLIDKICANSWVSFSGRHVIFVEAVIGNTVYYSDGNHNIGKNGNYTGYLFKTTKDRMKEKSSGINGVVIFRNA